MCVFRGTYSSFSVSPHSLIRIYFGQNFIFRFWSLVIVVVFCLGSQTQVVLTFSLASLLLFDVNPINIFCILRYDAVESSTLIPAFRRRLLRLSSRWSSALALRHKLFLLSLLLPSCSLTSTPSTYSVF